MDWCAVAEGKRQEIILQGKTTTELLKTAGASVPKETHDQIRMDVPRTFGGIPACCQVGLNTPEAEVKLERILLAFELRNANAQVEGLGASYTQGMNYLAGACLGLCGCDEELGFYLFARLVEDVLGLGYFCEWPPMVSHHADAAVLPALAKIACPSLAHELQEDFPDVIAMLTTKLLVTCFICSAFNDVHILTIWAELLGQSFEQKAVVSAYRRLPLHRWFIGALKALEADLLKAVRSSPVDERPVVAFSEVMSGLVRLPQNWRPGPLPKDKALIVNEVLAVRRHLVTEAHKCRATNELGLPLQVVDKLHAGFLRLQSLPGHDGIDSESFCKLLAEKAPSYRGQGVALFMLLDRDGSRCLDFFELMTGLLALSDCGQARKLQLLFQLYDTDSSGALEIDELHCLAISLAKLSNIDSVQTKDAAPAAIVASMRKGQRPSAKRRQSLPTYLRRNQIFASMGELEKAEVLRRRFMLMDQNRDGKLSLSEWTAGVMSDPAVMHLLADTGIAGASSAQKGQASIRDNKLPEDMLLSSSEKESDSKDDETPRWWFWATCSCCFNDHKHEYRAARSIDTSEGKDQD